MGVGENGGRVFREQEDCCKPLRDEKEWGMLQLLARSEQGTSHSQGRVMELVCAPQGSVPQHLFPALQRTHIPSHNLGSCPDKHLRRLPVPERKIAGSMLRPVISPFFLFV